MGLKILDAKKLELENEISNEYFYDFFETSDQWIRSRTGIEKRFYAEESAAEMAVSVAKKLKFDKDDIRLLIVPTFSARHPLPAVSCVIHQELKLSSDCLAFDINMACTGFIGALILAEKYLQQGEKAMIIATEKISSYLNFEDRTSAILFGDGCAGVIVEKNHKLWFSKQNTFGDVEALKLNEEEKLSMKGKDIYRFAVNEVSKSINSLLKSAKIDVKDIELALLHQANSRIIEQIALRLEMDLKKFPMNLNEQGNTSAASIPILLSENMNRIKERDLVLFSAFGAGLTLCTVLMEW
ncbi:3-oxoacyl-[acyl-carrier-protein] synthase III [Peptoniphilus sp. ING2-D1G]|nr:3-oxoacyl-[acyl-carrier-protein] synthase III [Peptoniphilus sp. ING2-D1G]